jgi:CDP-diacylglycerol---glycerol-3-phosphate 3-phosphatidyltransferase
MNLPNKLTVSRIGLTLVMVFFLTVPDMRFGKTLALLVFALAGITDYWDGRIARTSQKISIFGQLMDPLADKILVSAAFISFASIQQAGHASAAFIHQIVPAWIVILIISREFLITGLRLLAAQRGRVLPASKWGKHKMIWQTIVIVVIMFGLAMQRDILPLVLKGEQAASVMHVFNRGFPYVSFMLSMLVAILTVISGGVYLWHSRELYLEQI